MCLRQLTLDPPAGFLAGLPSLEVVGVALAAPVHELAAALSVPVVVKTGDLGAAVPHLRGQEADLRVVSYRRGRRVGEREGGQPHPQGGRSFRVQRGLYRESTLWGIRGPLPRQGPGERERVGFTLAAGPGGRGACRVGRYLEAPEQHRQALFPSRVTAETTARGYK